MKSAFVYSVAQKRADIRVSARPAAPPHFLSSGAVCGGSLDSATSSVFWELGFGSREDREKMRIANGDRRPTRCTRGKMEEAYPLSMTRAATSSVKGDNCISMCLWSGGPRSDCERLREIASSDGDGQKAVGRRGKGAANTANVFKNNASCVMKQQDEGKGEGRTKERKRERERKRRDKQAGDDALSTGDASKRREAASEDKTRGRPKQGGKETEQEMDDGQNEHHRDEANNIIAS